MGRFESVAGKVSAAAVPDQMDAASAACVCGDYPTALQTWGPLAHAGVRGAQAYIGACFAERWRVEPDFDLAARWLTLAADAGDRADRQAMLGAAHYLERDPHQALVWLLRATVGKSELASQFLNAARSVLTADEIAEAERRVSLPLPEPTP